MAIPCDLCGAAALTLAYTPDSPRGLTVHVCGACGLVQSTPRMDRTKERHSAAVSGGADWGNVRYGKGFRTGAALEGIAAHADLNAALAVLDVGSNRGSFARALLEAAPRAALTAVEPDERFAQSCGDLERTELIHARIEHTALPAGHFDIVHSCHTIEHLARPFEALKDHARVLKHDGLLVIDAPNIALIGGQDIAEEWFIDKHLFHFSSGTLRKMIEAAGFDVIQAPDPSDRVNLLFLARKTKEPATVIAPDPAEAQNARHLMTLYQATRARNLAALKTVASAIDALAPRRVALWGAGRLFDLLVKEGGFDPKSLSLLIDTQLKVHMDTRHGMALSGPEDLTDQTAEVVIVMSRMFAGEIAHAVRSRAPRAQVLLYADLLADASARPATQAA